MTSEKLLKKIINRIKDKKLEHAHKSRDKAYDCGCAWHNDAIDEIVDDIQWYLEKGCFAKEKWLK